MKRIAEVSKKETIKCTQTIKTPASAIRDKLLLAVYCNWQDVLLVWLGMALSCELNLAI